MYSSSKVRKIAFDRSNFGQYFGEDIYVAYCNSQLNFEEEFNDGSFHYIARNTYEEVSDHLQKMHEKAGHKISTFLIDHPVFSESKGHKYVIGVRDLYYHYLINTLITILLIVDNDPEAEFYVFTDNKKGADWGDESQETTKNLEFLWYLLNFHGIKNYFFMSDHRFNNHPGFNHGTPLATPESVGSTFCQLYPVYKFYNVTLIRDYSTLFERPLGDIVYLVDKYIKTLDRVESKESIKKIYISRGGNTLSESAFIDPDKPELGYKNDIRVFNEAKLEKYLENLGFYIFRNSDFYNHFDQISLLSSASLIVGPTGTGLINCLFMESGKTVIELKMELLDFMGYTEQEAVPYYADYSYARGHQYISLDVSDKQADTAIAKLDKLFNSLDLDKL
jgi:hypothetical protein